MGKRVEREKRKKEGKEREIICPASSVEQADGDLWSVRSTSSEVLEYTLTQSEAQTLPKSCPCFGEGRGTGLLMCL